jgi:aspartate-semialdehyde dehydrogenase
MTLVTDPAAPRIAIIGATGAVGSTLIELIEERRLPYREIHLVASGRSARREITVDGRPYAVVALPDFDFGRADLAFFSAGTSVSEKWGRHAASQGTLVIDNTNACSTIPLVRLLQTIEQRWGIRKVVVSTYQAASGQGHQGVEELQEGSELRLRDPDAELPAERFRPALAFNVVPFIDRLLDSGFTLEEQKMLQESRKILGLPHLDVTATCVRVPVVNGHSESAWIEVGDQVDRDELIARLDALPEVTVHDKENRAAFPTPQTAGHPDHVHVGRIRIAPHNPRGFWLWLVSDNLRVGAALNAVQIAESVIAAGLLNRDGVR